MGIKRFIAVAAALGALCAGLAACGGGEDASGTSASSGSGQFEESAKAVAQARKTPEFTLDAPKFDAKKASGKKLFIIPLNSAIPFVQGLSKEIESTARQIGVEAFLFNNSGTPNEWAKGVDQAVAQGADAILLVSSPDPRLIVPALRGAKKAGVPVIVGHQYQNGEGPGPEVADLITATTTAPFNEGAELAAEAALAETGDKTNALILTSSELQPSDGMEKAMKETFAARCPDCKTTVINVPATEWTTKIRPEVESALAKDPDINWVLPTFDSMSLGAQAGVMAAGKGNSVRIASYNGTADVLELVQKDDIVHTIVGESPAWLAWSMLDQALRVMSGVEPTEDGYQATPLRLFDDTNIEEVGTPPNPGQGYGGDIFREGYSKLWGVTP